MINKIKTKEEIMKEYFPPQPTDEIHYALKGITEVLIDIRDALQPQIEMTSDSKIDLTDFFKEDKNR